MKKRIPSSSRLIRSVFGFCLLLLAIFALALIRPATAGNSVPADGAIRHDSSKGLVPAASTITVNSLEDGPDTNIGDGICDSDAGAAGAQCTLRAAVQESNSAPSTYTINFNLPVTATITLSTPLPPFIGNVNIAGPGSSLLTIQRSTIGGMPPPLPNFRFFTFVPINGNFNNSISGLTLYNGLAPTGGGFSSDQGGSVLNSSSCTLTMTGVTIRNSSATSGGAFYNAGTATLFGSEIISSSATNGGAIYNSGTLAVTYSSVKDNQTTNGGSGGGIFIQSGTVTATYSTITGNKSGNGASSSAPGGDGGGIYSTGTLNVISSTVSGNTTGNGGAAAAGGNGGGIYNASSLVLTTSTVSGNQTGTGTTTGAGGGIMNGGSATLTNSTVSSNQIGTNNQGSGIHNYGTLTLANATVCNNTGGSGIFSSASTSLKDTLVANNTANGLNSDLSGTFSSQDYNLIKAPAGATINGTTTHNIIGQDPLVGPLADNSSETKTHALLVGSPAIDAGNSSQPGDQRSRSRPFDDPNVPNASGGNATDIGAYEARIFQVNSTADADDGSCTAVGTGNGCTLREAMTAANADAGQVSFAPALTSGGATTISLTSALPLITTSMIIQGPGANLMTVKRSTAGGTPNFRVFFIDAAIPASISGLTIANGNVPNGFGGGVLNNGILTLTDCNLYGNNAASGGGGGAIASGIQDNVPTSLTLINSNIGGLLAGQPNTASSGAGVFLNTGPFSMTGGSVAGNSGQGLHFVRGTATLNGVTIINNTSPTDAGGGVWVGGIAVNITNCLIAGNTALRGAGVWSLGGGVAISNSTISGNSSTNVGGGIEHDQGITIITNTTITNNRADSDNSGSETGGGIRQSSGTVVLRNTIVAQNFRGTLGTADDISSTTSIDTANSVNNLIGVGGAGGLIDGFKQNQVGIANPGLNPLASNGGSIQTHALLPGSPAIDAGDSCVLNNSCSTILGSGLTGSALITDQRGSGFNRSMDGNGDGTARVDIGAYEVQSFLVTNTADSGSGSLRQAIIDANANPGTKAINFQLGLTGTIDLLSALPPLSTSMGISGPGANLLTVQRSNAGGTPNFRVFTINSGKTVSISNLTVSNGHTADGDPSAPSGSLLAQGVAGGGILNAGTLTLTNVQVTGNSTGNGAAGAATTISFAGQGGNGGGIFNSGTLTLTDVTVGGNSTGNGGLGLTGNSHYGGAGGDGAGIFSSGPLTMTRVTVSNNTAGNGNSGGTGGGGGSGGGVAHSALLTMTDCTVSGNMTGQGGVGSNAGASSGGSGGGGGVLGVFYPSGTLVMKNSVVSGNRTANGASGGSGSSGGTGAGVLINYNATGTIINSTITDNHTGDGLAPISQGGFGGGIYNGGTLDVIGTTISGNDTGASSIVGGSLGGGVENDGSLTMTNCTVSGNHTGGIGGYGGGIVNNRMMTLINVTVTNNTSFVNVGHGVSHFSTLATSYIRNSLVAGNGQGQSGSDISGDYNSGGYNLVGNADNSTGFSAVGDKTGSGASPLNAFLGTLANNGGPTITHALLPGSPAINAGSNANLSADTFDLDGDGNTAEPVPFDQRGFARITNSNVDIGAFESRGFTIAAAGGTPQSATIMTAFSSPLSATVSSSFGETVAGGVVTFTAPGNGASGTFPAGMISATTAINGSGIATSPAFTANGIPGSYSVLASGNGISSSTTFALTNDKINQTITFGVLGDKTFGDPDFSVSATASSGLAVTFTPSGNCTMPSPRVVHLGAVGSCTITASQSGDATRNAAPDVPRTFAINKANQTITFNPLPNKTFGDPDFPVSVTASSNLPVSFSASGACTVSSGSVHITGAGSCTITASQPGDNNFNAATPMPQTFNIADIISINDVSTTEGDSGTKALNFTVTLVSASNQTVTASYSTASDTASAPSDYVSISPTTLTFNPGDMAQTISLTINGDQSFEPNETLFVNLANPTNAVISDNQGVGTILNDDAQGGIISFSQSNYSVSESGGLLAVTVNRTGDRSAAAAVDYGTSDGGASSVPCSSTGGLASARCDFTTSMGTLNFGAGETQKSFTVLVNGDSYNEGPESFTVNLSNQTGGAILGTPSTAVVTIADDSSGLPPNTIDAAQFFVRQQYHDFLNREPDTSGLNFWTNQITSCGTDQACIELKRINVSAAFFLSIEFQDTGYLVERIYKAGYGDVNGTSTFGGTHQLPLPIVRFSEFLPDTQEIGQGVIVGQGTWQLQLENNKAAFAAEFVQRPRFITAFPNTMPAGQFVDTLNTNAGNPLSQPERDKLVSDLLTNATTRAQVLRAVAEDPDFKSAEFNRAFVLMQFFGYLRRNPNDAPDSNYTGYDFWLTKLNEFNGNFVNADMVKAFINSSEYRQRFGP
jgi:CSLREA domain-containing protein